MSGTKDVCTNIRFWENIDNLKVDITLYLERILFSLRKVNERKRRALLLSKFNALSIKETYDL